jgi:itaconate CoA-transferase
VPFTLATAQVPPAKPAPALGEHTDAVLAEVGVSAGEIAGLRERGVVG